MGTFVALHSRVYLGHLDLTSKARELSFGPLTRAMVPSSTYGDGGYATVLPGIISGEGSITGNQDWAADVADDEISIAQIGSQYAYTVIPNPTGTVTAGDACWFTRGILDQYSPLVGAVGDVASFFDHIAYDTAIPQGLVAHPLAARTADGDGTAVALVGPTAAQKLYAVIHVTAFSGFSNVVFKIQSDDNSGFTSATDRITLTTVTGVTNQFASVAGDFSTETHHRITWAKSGSGSVSFVAAFGVF